MSNRENNLCVCKVKVASHTSQQGKEQTYTTDNTTVSSTGAIGWNIYGRSKKSIVRFWTNKVEKEQVAFNLPSLQNAQPPS